VALVHVSEPTRKILPTGHGEHDAGQAEQQVERDAGHGDYRGAGDEPVDAKTARSLDSLPSGSVCYVGDEVPPERGDRLAKRQQAVGLSSWGGASQAQPLGALSV